MKTVRIAVVLAVAAGCGVPDAPKGWDARDVRGNYALTYDNQLKVRLGLAGGTREVTATGYGNILDFGTYQGQPLKLDLTQFCDRPEIQCPSEAFWSKVAIDQPDLKKNGLQLTALQVVNDTIHALDAGVKAQVVAGLVDNAQQDRFVVGLGASAASNSNCLLLGLSLAGGRFTHKGEKVETVTEFRFPDGKKCDPDAGVPDAGADAGTVVADAGATDGGLADAGLPPVCGPVMVKRFVIPEGSDPNGISEGRIGVGWAGGCAFGPIVAGAVLTIETGFTGTRTGDFDPPPYTPAEVTLPDGGFDGGQLDAGSFDGGSTDGG